MPKRYAAGARNARGSRVALQLLERSGPTIAGGERSEPPLQSAGREPGEVMSLAKITVEAESASASCGGAAAGAEAAVP